LALVWELNPSIPRFGPKKRKGHFTQFGEVKGWKLPGTLRRTLHKGDIQA